VTTFRRYVAIGDSTTEGLEDPHPQGGYRGWADRLAQHIADAQDEPLEYANLAIRGLRMQEIRTGQLDDALAMQPDLLSIFGGMNDVIAARCDFDAIRADYVVVFGQARRSGCTVLTFTMPDPTEINPLGWRLRERVNRLNAIIRSEGEAGGALVLDFDAYPAAKDPRLWYEDRLHGSTLGHAKAAAAMAWRLGIAGFDESWAYPLEGVPEPPRPRVPIAGDMDWAVHYLLPWLGKGVRRVPRGYGIPRKRPVPTAVPKSQQLR
jgi:lysophospholipase L1-like esterase